MLSQRDITVVTNLFWISFNGWSNITTCGVGTLNLGNLECQNVTGNKTISRWWGQYDFKQTSWCIENKEVRPLLISYGAYQATLWKLKPYPFTIRLNVTQKKIDKLSSVQVIVERTFGLLKGACLLKLLDNRLNNISFIIIASFVLHNIC